MNSKSPSRLYYIDNLRIFLISLVVLLHLNITYGGPGDWYYSESDADFPAILFQAMFNITNQSFFIGMFFMISAYFTAASIKRKPTGKFIKDRLIRLGIPLVVYYFLLSSLTNYFKWQFIEGNHASFLDFIQYKSTWGFGPLWFVETLLIFTFIYLLIRQLKITIKLKFPSTLVILLTAAVTGILQFIIRIWLPVGWSMPFTNLQFPFFLQYILLFVAGIIAYQNNWLEAITFKMGKHWFIFAQIMILIILPVVLYLGGKENGMDAFVGGVTWQSFTWAVWEQVTGFALIIGLLGISKKYFNKQGRIARAMSDSAYGVFVFHAPILVGISALCLGFSIPQLLKLVVLAPVVLAVSFTISWLVKQIPGVKKVL
ncbi:MAG: acyltransferase family protein [Prolixibacteraceae bacterium]|nr:acyltransferase family protein [Prolixibacteraceae bacterium]